MLSDGVVVLRPPQRRDADLLVQAASDPEIVRWTTVPTPYGRPDALAWIDDHLADWWSNPVWAITLGEPDWGGSLELRLDGAGAAEVGYLVAPWMRGRRAATRALRLACAWAFNAGGVEVIRWHCQVGNEASRAVATQVGFRIHADPLRRGLVHRGRRVDVWIGDLLASDLAETGRRGRPMLAALTKRERQVLGLMAQGRANRQIATTLGISENTVKNHVRAILAKLHASSRVDAVVRGVQAGLTRLP